MNKLFSKKETRLVLIPPKFIDPEDVAPECGIDDVVACFCFVKLRPAQKLNCLSGVTKKKTTDQSGFLNAFTLLE